MRDNEVVEIVGGTLLNTPSIAMFSRIICDVEQIEKGDLFIALEDSHITQAIQAGAYGVIYTHKIDMSDEEIAHILVEDMQDCLMRLIRYKLLARNIAFVALSSLIEEGIATNIINDTRVSFFNGDLCALIELLNDENIAFIFTNSEQILQLGFNIIHTNKSKEYPFLVLSHTLFDSTILYKEAHYRINLPKLFFSELNSVLQLCEQEGIDYALEQFKQIPFFKPNFLNAFGKIIEYGQASKVAIAEEDIEQFKRYMAYIANNATWGKILFLVPPVYVELFNQIAQTFPYSSHEELCGHLHRENFNFALILGIDDESLVCALNTNRRYVLEPDLFSTLLSEEQA